MIDDVTARFSASSSRLRSLVLVAVTAVGCREQVPTRVQEGDAPEWRPLTDCPEPYVNPDTSTVNPGAIVFPQLHTGASWSQQGLIAFVDYGFECVVERGNGSALYDPELNGIWVIDPASGEKERVVQGGGPLLGRPTWSPDGKSIAFHYSGKIYVVQVDNGHVTRLTDEGRNFDPAWSPDGSWIAYNRSGEIWLIRPDGTDNHSLDPRPRTTPAWHPLGNMILHVHSANESNELTAVIGEISVDGRTERDISQRAAIDLDPTYSADGQWIAFDSLDPKKTDPYAAQIWIMRPDGTDQNQITVCGGIDPSWSPDGRMIIYTKYLDNGSPEDGVLWLIDVASRTEKQLTFHPPCDQ